MSELEIEKVYIYTGRKEYTGLEMDREYIEGKMNEMSDRF